MKKSTVEETPAIHEYNENPKGVSMFGLLGAITLF